jgi:hypothetical protein
MFFSTLILNIQRLFQSFLKPSVESMTKNHNKNWQPPWRDFLKKNVSFYRVLSTEDQL